MVILTSLKQRERLLWAGDGVAFMRLRERDPDLLASVGVYVHLLTPCPLARKQMVLDLYSQTV